MTKENKFIKAWNDNATQLASVQIGQENFKVLQVGLINKEHLKDICLVVASEITPDYYNGVDFIIQDAVRYTADELIDLFLDQQLLLYVEQRLFIEQV